MSGRFGGYLTFRGLSHVSKINYDQFVHHKISEPRLIAAWLSGYYNAKRNNRVIDLQTMEENMSKVQNYCSDEKNFKVPVMKAIEQILGKSADAPAAFSGPARGILAGIDHARPPPLV